MRIVNGWAGIHAAWNQGQYDNWAANQGPMAMSYLAGSWTVGSSYDLSVYGPNGFVRYFRGSIGSGAAVLNIAAQYDEDEIELRITNVGAQAAVSVLDAYTGNATKRSLARNETAEYELSLEQFHGWYDLIVTVGGDPTFKYRLAGHARTERTALPIPLSGVLLPSRVNVDRRVR